MADDSSKSSTDPSAAVGPSKEANKLLPEETELDHDGFHNDHQDHLDMQRLGKKQQFKRTFSLWSSIGFVAIYMATIFCGGREFGGDGFYGAYVGWAVPLG
ncbi:hypothetical protein LB505_008383 [Fusarium chuoi]|nr:hypothetical protein LB505_008383 [Fusarium chuoi]